MQCLAHTDSCRCTSPDGNEFCDGASASFTVHAGCRSVLLACPYGTELELSPSPHKGQNMSNPKRAILIPYWWLLGPIRPGKWRHKPKHVYCISFILLLFCFFLPFKSLTLSSLRALMSSKQLLQVRGLGIGSEHCHCAVLVSRITCSYGIASIHDVPTSLAP